ncbi:MAG: hypothetical protein QOE36_3199 [Gaiellaceae bacterium]|nr:hypothetical protein [Gaiellaceae bacterium]
MKRRLLDLIACPVCAGDLELRAGEEEIERGELTCAGCGARYPIERGIPRLLPPELAAPDREIQRAFGWQWQHFDEIHPETEAQLLDWLQPLRPDDFRDKVVLDAGCGSGRNSHFALEWGAREVVAMDLSLAVEAAQRRLGDRPNVHVVQGDILNPPFRRAGGFGPFDLIFSVGVLDHMPQPRAGFDSLVGLLGPGGGIAAWVYGWEGNGFVRRVVDPVRSVTTRMPPPLLRSLSWPLGLALHGVSRGVYAPLGERPAGRRLPLRDYLLWIAPFTLRNKENIVFDQLVSPTVHYLRREEVEDWVRGDGLERGAVSHRHGNSWRVQASRAASAVPTGGPAG